MVNIGPTVCWRLVGQEAWGQRVHTNLKRLVDLQESCKKAEDYKCIFTAVSSDTGMTEK